MFATQEVVEDEVFTCEKSGLNRHPNQPDLSLCSESFSLAVLQCFGFGTGCGRDQEEVGKPKAVELILGLGDT